MITIVYNDDKESNSRKGCLISFFISPFYVLWLETSCKVPSEQSFGAFSFILLQLSKEKTIFAI